MGQIARCFYYFFMIVVVIRYKTKATARRALTFIVRIFVNDTIAIAVWTSFHVCASMKLHMSSRIRLHQGNNHSALEGMRVIAASIREMPEPPTHEARRIASNIAKLPTFLLKRSRKHSSGLATIWIIAQCLSCDMLGKWPHR